MPITLEMLQQARSDVNFKRTVRAPRPAELCDFINSHFPSLKATLSGTSSCLVVHAVKDTILLDAWSPAGRRACGKDEVVFEQPVAGVDVIIRWILDQLDFSLSPDGGARPGLPRSA